LSGLNINDQGKIDPREAVRTREEVIDQAMGLLGRRFVLQNSDLHAGRELHPVTDFVMTFSGRVITGLEMRCPAERCSPAMGAEGDPPRIEKINRQRDGAERRVPRTASG